MDAIDIYLGHTKEVNNKHIFSDIGLSKGVCCDNDNNLIWSDCYWTCIECGMCHMDKTEYVDDYEPFKSPYILKTMIPYNNKNKHIRRLHKWQNWSFKEIECNKLQDIIKSKDLPIKIKDSACYLVEQYYIKEKIVSRSKIRISLLMYCVYRSYLFKGIDIDIRDLFSLFDIKPRHYNQLVKKLDNDEYKLFYPPNFDMLSSKYDIDNNKAIRLYSEIFNNKKYRFNRRTLILGIIYHLLDEDNRDTFYDDMKISKNTINKVLKVII